VILKSLRARRRGSDLPAILAVAQRGIGWAEMVREWYRQALGGRRMVAVHRARQPSAQPFSRPARFRTA
jgi:hypothetical protein